LRPQRPSTIAVLLVLAVALLAVLGTACGGDGATEAETAAAGGAPGGEMPPSPVGYTEAREMQVRRDLKLTGSVAARQAGVVASQVAGMVVELAARDGDAVRRGQPLVKLRRQQLELQLAERRAALAEAEARFELAQRNLARAEGLYASKVISNQELDDARSEAAAWKGRTESLRAEIARVDDDLERSAVRAPYDGVVVAERTQVGQWLDVGDPAVELVGLDDLEVVVEVPERQFAGLASGAPATVRFEALPGVEIRGRIGAVVPRADPEARTFPVKVRFSNPEHRIGVGMLAQVELPVGEERAAVVVPKDAVVRRGEQSVVYRIDDQQQAQPVEVAPGTAVGEWIEVEGEIAAGDRVVTRGNERLQPGQKVAGSPVEYQTS
jgi:RND family efflux transporter MFP subunit